MSEAKFPMPTTEVMTTLAEIFRHQQSFEIVEILDTAYARIDDSSYDSWDGGFYTWVLFLEIPVQIFASLEARMIGIEQEIVTKVKHIVRNCPNNSIREVRITPISSGSSLLGTRMTPSDFEVRRLWPDGRFRLFLSHLSDDKVEVSALKSALEIYGITAFVAHEDIEPTLQWRDEIELGLKSMHALVALVTPEFHNSHWTDQEIGWALGRSIPVISVRLGKDPRGFAGKFQALSGSLAYPELLAKSIVGLLIANPNTQSEMRRAAVKAFSSSRSFNRTIALKKLIITATGFSEEEKKELQKACVSNPYVSDAYHVPAAIYRITGRPVTALAVPSVNDEVPF